MSQVQYFTDGNSPVIPDVQYIQGTNGVNVGPDGSFIVYFTSSDGDLSIIGNAGTNTLDFNLANKYEGTAQTIGAVTADIITFDLGAVAGTFQFEARVKLFESTTPAGAGYNLYATFRTDGASATLIGQQEIFNEDAVLSSGDVYFVASGNNAIIQALGVAGLTIDWEAEMEVT